MPMLSSFITTFSPNFGFPPTPNICDAGTVNIVIGFKNVATLRAFHLRRESAHPRQLLLLCFVVLCCLMLCYVMFHLIRVMCYVVLLHIIPRFLFLFLSNVHEEQSQRSSYRMYPGDGLDVCH